jgi:exosome complex component RRP4
MAEKIEDKKEEKETKTEEKAESKEANAEAKTEKAVEGKEAQDDAEKAEGEAKPQAEDQTSPQAEKVPEAKGLLKKEREFVIPGDKIVETMDYLPGRNCFRRGDSVFAKKIGLVSISGRVVSVIPMSGVYVPRPGDMVMGGVKEVQSNAWVVDIESVNEAYLPISGVREFIDTTRTDLSRYYAVGDLLYAKINTASQGSIHLSMDDSRARKFRSGRIIRVNPAKVPRLIGKQGSMISLIKGRTGCRISVGQNGIVWLEGEKEDVAIDAIRLVDKESYTEGLTDRISEMLDKALGTKTKRIDEAIQEAGTVAKETGKGQEKPEPVKEEKA